MKSTLFTLATFIPLALAVGLTSSTNSTTSSICYNLDGSEAPDDVPCGAGDVVNCCNVDDLCMSNGLCMQQGERGGGLARGSCTDNNWGSRCYAPCSGYNRNSGISIVHIGFDDEEEYCCGDAATSTANDDDDDDDAEDEQEITCQYGDPFTIAFGTVIPNVAGLSNHPSSSDKKNSGDSDNRISTGLAITLGIGLPLGLAFMGVVLWAIWERRRRYLRAHYGEVDGQARMGMMMPMNSTTRLTALHDLYGPVPSVASSRRGSPNVSGVTLPRPSVGGIATTPMSTDSTAAVARFDPANVVTAVQNQDQQTPLQIPPRAPGHGTQSAGEPGHRDAQ
ncbi:hypothetical protein BDV06DRAFT_131027 [Aspergillus oleicola]